eukprot:CAMPEP_0174263416 /NCGR_PEP_ID=MMETSP0439-20130205/18581_1 /TAXON_ID=0 /ORGANISM="Stereomyxa ramosa, Strain Chinc5" /LENGTH=406 /DNA_ID=CAMNT_0015348743 /DNA_START=15 /DNA_END=1235 /DNA_ORIENTATION=+
MGSYLSVQRVGEPERVEFGPKNSYFEVPETKYDKFEVVGEDFSVPEIPRYELHELRQAAQSPLLHDSARLCSSILDQLVTNRFLIISLNEDEQEAIDKLYQETESFMSQPTHVKESQAPPLKIDDLRTAYSGYSYLTFENRDSIREKENRDVLQLRLSEDIPWPNEELQHAATAVYLQQWSTALDILRCLEVGLGLEEQSLQQLTVGKSEEIKPEVSQNTNLCLFRYFQEEDVVYSTPQSCMVHQDSGLITILPRSTYPGIQLFNHEHKVWVPLEYFMKENEMVVYGGVALQHITNQQLPAAVHRVVRYNHKLRYSQPFEVKPVDDLILPVYGKYCNQSEEDKLYSLYECWEEKEEEEITYDRLQKRLTWQRVMRQVGRSDDAATHRAASDPEDDPSGFEGTDMAA